MTKRKPVSNAERRSSSIEALLNAAQHLFVTQRFNTTTIDQIAERAGLSKGAVYFYFRDKINVLLTLLERVESEIYEPVFAMLRDDSLPAQERLVRFIHQLSRTGQSDREALLLPIIIAPEFREQGGPVEQKVKTLYRRFAEAMETVIDAGGADGTFASHGPTREMAAVLVALSDGMLLEWVRRGEDLDGAAFVATARHFLLAAMKRPDA